MDSSFLKYIFDNASIISSKFLAQSIDTIGVKRFFAFFFSILDMIN